MGQEYHNSFWYRMEGEGYREIIALIRNDIKLQANQA